MLRIKHTFRSDARIAADLVGYHFGVSAQHILWDRRRSEYVRARHVAWWLVREGKGWSLPRVGKAFKRNHTTIMNGLGQHEIRMDRDPIFAEKCRRVLDQYRTQSNQIAPKWASEGDALREIWGNRLSPFYVT